MATFKALTRGTQIVLVAGALFFLSLFLTWQNLEVDYGRSGVNTQHLDGFDAWGLLLVLLVLSTLAIVALRNLTDVEMSEEIPWEKVAFGLGVATASVAVLKSLTDRDSSWLSYGFVALAIAVAAGTYMEWAESRRGSRPLLAQQKRRGIRSAA